MDGAAGVLTTDPDFPQCLIEVDIDIKPGSFPNSINVKSKGVVPVAILGSNSFDVGIVDISSVIFGPAGASPVHDGHLEDVNDDGHTDLMFHFRQKKTGLVKGDTEATLTGATTGGTTIEGTDSVNTKPGKPLHVAGDPGDVLVGQRLTSEMLEQAVPRAVGYWTTDSSAHHAVAELARVDVQIGELDGTMLGYATHDTVWIDRDAAGYGWSDSGGVDLLSVIKHEFGHVLGRDHDHGGLMVRTLAPNASRPLLVTVRDVLADSALPTLSSQRDVLFNDLNKSDDSEALSRAEADLFGRELLPTASASRLDRTLGNNRSDLDESDLVLEKILDELYKELELDGDGRLTMVTAVEN